MNLILGIIITIFLAGCGSTLVKNCHKVEDSKQSACEKLGWFE